MYVNDPIGDMLTRIRNGQRAKKEKVRVPLSKERCAVLNILRDEGYIRGYCVTKGPKAFDELMVELKYCENQPVIQSVDRVSKPGRRVYKPSREIGSVHSGLGIYIVSTSQGVMSDVDAKAKGLGGEIICKVF